MNPVLRRELLRRWRRPRASLVLVLFLLALSLVTWGLHEIGRRVLEGQAQWIGADAAFLRPQLGRFMVESVLATLLGLVLVAAPGFAAGQIAGERERGSLPLLQATLMTPSQIVLGKLWASTAWVGLLVVAALPLVTVSTVFGGVELLDVVLGLAVVLVMGLCVGAMALGVSSVAKRTTSAVVITYALVLLLILGTGFMAILVGLVQESPEGAIVPLYANPFTALAGAVNTGEVGGILSLPSPLTPFAYLLRAGNFENVGFGGDFDRTWHWLRGVGLLVAFAVLAFFVAVRRVRLTRPTVAAPIGRFREPAPAAAGPTDG